MGESDIIDLSEKPELMEKCYAIYRGAKYSEKTIEFIKNNIHSEMTLLEIRNLCEAKMMELGADSFWYWDVGAFVFSGDETTVSVSGTEYVTSDKIIDENDIVTIDLSPQNNNIWGDYARTIIIQDGTVAETENINMVLCQDLVQVKMRFSPS